MSVVSRSLRVAHSSPGLNQLSRCPFVWVLAGRAPFIFHLDMRLCRFLKVCAFPVVPCALPCSLFWCSRTRQWASEVRKLLPIRRQFSLYLHTALQDLHSLNSFLYLVGESSRKIWRETSYSVLLDFHSILHIYFRFRDYLSIHDVVQWLSGCGCFRSFVKIRSLSSRSSFRLLLPSSSIAIAKKQQHRSNTSRRRLVQGWSICPSIPGLFPLFDIRLCDDDRRVN